MKNINDHYIPRPNLNLHEELFAGKQDFKWGLIRFTELYCQIIYKLSESEDRPLIESCSLPERLWFCIPKKESAWAEQKVIV